MKKRSCTVNLNLTGGCHAPLLLAWLDRSSRSSPRKYCMHSPSHGESTPQSRSRAVLALFEGDAHEHCFNPPPGQRLSLHMLRRLKPISHDRPGRETQSPRAHHTDAVVRAGTALAESTPTTMRLSGSNTGKIIDGIDQTDRKRSFHIQQALSQTQSQPMPSDQITSTQRRKASSNYNNKRFENEFSKP